MSDCLVYGNNNTAKTDLIFENTTSETSLNSNGLPQNTNSNANNMPKMPTKFALPQNDSRILIGSSALLGILFMYCFYGEYKLPQLSSFVFCLIAAAVTYFMFKRLDVMKNKSAFLLSIPICVFAAFNAIFAFTFTSALNIMVILFLTALMCYLAANDDVTPDFGSARLWKKLSYILAFDMISPFSINKSLFSKKQKEGESVSFRIFLGLLIVCPLFLVIFALLLSADTVFSSLISDIIAKLFILDTNVFWDFLIFLFVTFYIVSFFSSAISRDKNQASRTKPINADKIIAGTFLAALNALFLVFCIIQFAFLFTGGLMSLPYGISYAEYARQGFFQLVFITIINFLVLIVFIKALAACLENKILKLLLVSLCIFTGVLIGSSFYRMFLYISANTFTYLRLLVLTFLAAETVLIFIMLKYLKSQSFDILKYFVIVMCVFVFTANLTTNSRTIARLNISAYLKNPGSVELDTTNLDYADGIDLFVELYESGKAGESEMRKIESLLENRKRLNEAANPKWQSWQNWSYYKSKSLKASNSFIGLSYSKRHFNP